jgi:hypothetical protein
MQLLLSFTVAAALALLSAAPCARAADETCTPTRDGRLVCPAPDTKCVADRTGEVICSSPGGGIEFDRYGEPVCGPGYCTKDLRGDLFCSKLQRGAASVDRYGNAACAGSCVPARAQACTNLKRSN